MLVSPHLSSRTAHSCLKPLSHTLCLIQNTFHTLTYLHLSSEAQLKDGLLWEVSPASSDHAGPPTGLRSLRSHSPVQESRTPSTCPKPWG